MGDIAHISSLLLRVDPKKMDGVLQQIEAVDLAEVPLSDPAGRVIVMLETPSEAEIVETMNELQLIDGVVSAALIYHQTDAETE